MPTGYTADVMDGKVTDFKLFAMQCARAFGALVIMRDEPLNAEIPDEFSPSNYHLQELEQARERLAKLQSMTMEEVQAACQHDYEEAIAQRDKYKSEQTLENKRLEDMEAHVRRWQPPSDQHTEMKKFMLEQIKISKHSMSDFDLWYEVKKLSPRKWLDGQLEKARKNIGYHAAEHEKEVERTKNRNLWVKQLRESLEGF